MSDFDVRGMNIRLGNGFDVHRLVPGRKLILGGVEVPGDLGLEGHSDAAVALHAVADALLGALALGDIGVHFPDNDDRYLGADSAVLLGRVAEMVRNASYAVSNVDLTVVAQKPKLSPYITDMREKLADALSLSSDRVNVKATTEEKMGFTGRGEGISAHAVCLLRE